MDRLDTAAKICGRLNQLEDFHRKAMASQNWAKVTDLQTKIDELTKRRDDILSGLAT